MTDYRQERSIIRQALLLASDRIQRILYEGLAIQIKPDGSPVTNADLEVNRILQEALFAAYPDDGWLSEESPDNAIRLKKNRVWILDPIDGTKPFIKSLPQFAISLALIDHGQASIGIIFNPATREYFCAVRGEPATLNGIPIQVRQTTGHRLSFLVNAGPINRSTIRTWRETANCRTLMGSIAYSLALVATGQIDGVINLSTQNEWDIAAALLLVQAAGGVVVDGEMKPIQCNQPHPTLNGIIAARPDAMPVIRQFLASLPA
ncbi:MAG TPA: 3'(2'),5'-bisphosphate nucleotidase CysQ [Nitrospirales bacterium]|nr:3'(2'),5'-bisphosphate nucleotidase CysQ [Nitrospiraceae bacterium]HNP28582.1 3'(2'),5'-bisphosphate nucleotidase CysQ [Nitrospirales bacterium]